MKKDLQKKDIYSSQNQTLNGTILQKKVWKEISLIPFGVVITYSEFARRCG
jgi:O6-methylguanine-DNA--protein-cysteine methyltransferase